MFTIYSDRGTDSTAVSNLFIDEYMRSANDAQIKVYLYLLRLTGAHRPASISDLADRFNHTEKDVVRSLRYWERKGLLDLTFGSGDDLISICLKRPGENVLSFPSQALAGSGQDAAGAAPAYGNAAPAYGNTAPAYESAAPACGNAAPAYGNTAPAYESAAPVCGNAVSAYGKSAPACGNAVSAYGKSAPACESAAPAYGSAAAKGAASSFSVSCSETDADSFSSGGVPKKAQDDRNRKKDGPDREMEALESFCGSKNRAQLLFAIEQYIGKPLTLNEIRILFHISEDLRFSDDLIDYLLQYCVDRGKKDFRYIAKVADNWAKNGITTPAQAEASSEEIAEKAKAAGKKTCGGAKNPQPKAKEGPQAGLNVSSGGSRRAKSANSFNQFEQNSYDFDALEDELLSVAGN